MPETPAPSTERPGHKLAPLSLDGRGESAADRRGRGEGDQPATSNPASSIKRPASKRGGRRPGAGAPKGNLNALKGGRYSRQVKALKLALKAAPATAGVLRNLDAAGDNKRALFAMALQHTAELILLGDPAAIQSMKTGVINPAQIRAILQNDENNQTIKPANSDQRPVTSDPNARPLDAASLVDLRSLPPTHMRRERCDYPPKD